MKKTINRLRITGVLPLAALVFDPTAQLQAYGHGSFVLPRQAHWRKIVAQAIANG
jgi:hypothetical protein